jgi:hypothetical protein
MLKGTPEVSKKPYPYFISTRDVCRADDILEILVGIMSLVYRPPFTITGAMLSVAFIYINPKAFHYSEGYAHEEEGRIGRIKSICCSLLIGTTIAFDRGSSVMSSYLGGFYAIGALARQVLP